MVPTELPHGASDATYAIDDGSDVPFVIPELKGTISEYNRRMFETPLLSAGRHTITITYRSGTDSTPLALGNLLITGGTNKRAIDAPTNPESGDTGNTGGNGSGGSANNGGNGGSNNTPGNVGNTTGEGSGNGNTGPNQGDTSSPKTGNNSTNTGSSSSASGLPVPNHTIYIRPSDTSAQVDDGNPGENSLNEKDAVSTSSTPTGAIVGGVLGAVAIVLLAVAIFFFLRQRKRKQRLEDTFNPASLTMPISANDPPNMSYYAAPSVHHAQPYTDAAYPASDYGTSAYSGISSHVRGPSANTSSDGQSVGAFYNNGNGVPHANNPFENPPPLYSR